MDPFLVAFLGLAVMFGLILLHVPIGIAMLLVGTGGYMVLEGIRPAISVLITETVGSIESPSLAVIPLFLLMGSFATAGGLSKEIFRFANAMVGHRKGGLAMATMGGCGIFGAVCGSSTATAATFGRVALPEMLERNYAPHFAAGVIAAGGTLGALVPPSVIMIIYAVVTRENILDLFTAAIVPAVMAIGFHFIAIRLYLIYKPDAAPAGERVSWREKAKAAGGAWAALVLLISILGSIYGGLATVEEAAAGGAVLSLLFSIVRGRLTWATFRTALIESAATTAMIYIIIFGASVFSYFITIAGVPPALTAWVGGLDLPPIMIIFLLLIIYVIFGAIFDTVSAMLITLPFVLPIILELGYDPIWWGIINVVVVELGMITPPIGMNVFVLHSLAPGISLSRVFAGVSPFVASDLLRLILLTLFPILTLYTVY